MTGQFLKRFKPPFCADFDCSSEPLFELERSKNVPFYSFFTAPIFAFHPFSAPRLSLERVNYIPLRFFLPPERSKLSVKFKEYCKTADSPLLQGYSRPPYGWTAIFFQLIKYLQIRDFSSNTVRFSLLYRSYNNSVFRRGHMLSQRALSWHRPPALFILWMISYFLRVLR